MDVSGSVQKLDEQPVAHGGFSDIYRGILSEPPRAVKLVAIKVIVARRSSEEADRRIQRRLNREISTWKNLDHPSVIKLYGISLDFGRFPALVSPWYNNGNARAYLKTHPNVDRLNLLRGVATAVEYLHGLRPAVVHGDIKAANVFIKDDGEACLGDFGLSRFIQRASTGLTTTSLSGTTRWMAPELLFPKGDDLAPVTKEGDVYAFGCLAVEITTDQSPWHTSQNEGDVMLKVFEGRISPRPEGELAARELSDELWALIKTCWRYDPSQRPQARAIHSKLLSIIATKNPVSPNIEKDDKPSSSKMEGEITPLPKKNIADTVVTLTQSLATLPALWEQANVQNLPWLAQPPESISENSDSGEVENGKDNYMADSFARVNGDLYQLYCDQILPDVRRTYGDVQRILGQFRF